MKMKQRNAKVWGKFKVKSRVLNIGYENVQIKLYAISQKIWTKLQQRITTDVR